MYHATISDILVRMTKTRVLIVGAMDRELKGLCSYYNCVKAGELQGRYPAWQSRSAKQLEIQVLQTFVGEINASIATTLAIRAFKPDYVFKIGCVGGNAVGTHAGDVVLPIGFFSTSSWITRSKVNNNPTSDASKWQSVFGNKPYQVNRHNLGGLPYYFEPDAKVVKKYHHYMDSLGQKLRKCYIGSGNIWFFDKDCINNITNVQIPGQRRERTWSADMESYAVAQTCYVFNKPFMGFYRVSDNYFEDEPYIPDKVAQLFDRDFVSKLDEFLHYIMN